MQVCTYLQDDQLQLGDVVRVYPVFRCLTNEILLRASRAAVALGRVSSGANQIIQFRKLDNERIVIILEKRLCVEARGENWPQHPASLFLSAGQHTRVWTAKLPDNE